MAKGQQKITEAIRLSKVVKTQTALIERLERENKKLKDVTPPTDSLSQGEQLPVVEEEEQPKSLSLREVATKEGETPDSHKTAPRRPNRKPLHARNVLKFPQRPGFRRRIVNDPGDGSRVNMFLEAGYNHVAEKVNMTSDGEAGKPSQVGSNTERVVGSGSVAPIRGYLMEIPEEYYQEDQKAKQRIVDDYELAISQEEQSKVPGVYVPGGNKEGIELSHPKVN